MRKAYLSQTKSSCRSRRRLGVERLERRLMLTSVTDLSFGSAYRAGEAWRDLGMSVATDAQGNVHVAGIVEGSAFAGKYDVSGKEIWVRTMDGWFNTEGADIAVDGSGNVYWTGSFTGDLYSPTNKKLWSSTGHYSTYVLKLSSAGEVLWSRNYGGSNGDIYSTGIAVDANQNVYTTGYFRGTVDVDPGTGVTTIVSNGGSQDAFVAKLNSSGGYAWAAGTGGMGEDSGNESPGTQPATSTLRGSLRALRTSTRLRELASRRARVGRMRFFGSLARQATSNGSR